MPREKKPKLYAVQHGDEPSRAEQYVNDAAETVAARFREACTQIINRCESPIEELLMVALYDASKLCPDSLHFIGNNSFPAEPTFGEAAFVHQQVEVGPYRVDVLILDATLPDAPFRYMIVECDGHDFHEKTKQQARRDKQRDRFFQSKGFKILRYTGSEIWADPDQCAWEIIDELARNDHWRHRAP